MFSMLMSMLFPHGLVTPFFTIGPGGGSDSALAGGLASSGPVATSSVIVGDASALSASTVAFNVGVSTSGSSGSLDIFSHRSLRIICEGRQSAQIVGPLTVMVTIQPTDTAAATTLLSGWCAVMPSAGTGQSYPTTIANVSCLPGATSLSVSPLVSTMVTLAIPPGIRSDAIIPQVIGRDPVLVFSFSKVNVTSAQIVVSGRVALSGIGYWSGFF